jgi:hypothetical protein
MKASNRGLVIYASNIMIYVANESFELCRGAIAESSVRRQPHVTARAVVFGIPSIQLGAPLLVPRLPLRIIIACNIV